MSSRENTNNWNSVNQYQFLYRVKPGDSLHKIIEQEYKPKSDERADILNQILADNPEISNPDLIKANQLLLLKQYQPVSNLPPESLTYTPSLNDIANFKIKWENLSKPQQYAIEELSPAYNYLSLGSVGLGANLVAMNSLLSSNVGPLNDIPQAYTDYRSGKISKGQYDYLRKSRLDAFKNRIGPVRRLLYGDQTPHQVFRMKNTGGMAATKPVVQNISKLSKIADVASKGGLVLTVAGLASSCHQIANTNDRHEKNIIAVETATSTFIGLGSGVVIGTLLLATPIGWGVALAIGVGSAALSYGAGKGAGKVYDQYLKEYDVVDVLAIDQVCD